ncbi:MAG: MG2 domain-containing protein [Bacteroidota bacterium]|nr:MG2 domain-containing protein [Bacteroidota bacterium]
MKSFLKSIFLLSTAFFIVLFLSNCENNKTAVIQNKSVFKGHISGYTSGLISNSSTINIRLIDDVSEEVFSTPLEKNLFDFEPKIEGTTKWIDRRTIEFTPSDPLPSGTKYSANFKLGSLIDVDDDFEDFEFAFQTIQQAIFFEFNGLKAVNEDDLNWQKALCKIHTADHVDAEKLESIVDVLQSNKNLSVYWEHSSDGLFHEFVVDSIQRKETLETVDVSWNSVEIGAKENGIEIISIPPLGEFSVTNSTIVQHPDQILTLHFSDPLKRKQNINGLVRFKNQDVNVRLSVDGNDINVYPRKRLSGEYTIIVDQGLKNIMGYNLQSSFEQKVTFTSIKPAIEALSSGVILPSTDGLIYPFKAVNLKGVNVKIIKVFEDNIAQFFQVNQYDGSREIKRVGRIIFKDEIELISEKAIGYGSWNTFSIDLSKFISSEPGAIYKVQLSFDRSQSIYPCDQKYVEPEVISQGEDSELAQYDGPNSYYWDEYYDYYDDYYYEYRWEDRDNPCKDSYYNVNRRSVSSNIFASDLGIIAKRSADNKVSVAVTDIKTTSPLNGVTIAVYNYQNQLIQENLTDGDGLTELDLNAKPFFLVATKGNQKGYLRLDDGSSLSLSMFDVSGNRVNKGVKGFLYGERGVWRPGDSLYLSFILEDKNDVIAENHPVVFELYNPDNQLYERRVKVSSVNGLYDFRTSTEPTSPTGNWLAKVRVGGTVVSKKIKIETVKPNRLKINLDFNGKFISNENQSCEIQSTWLHGAKAKDLKTDVELSLKSGKTSFKEFDKYSFDDPSKSFQSNDRLIFEGKTNLDGKAFFNSDINVGEQSPGMLQANFKTRVFEKSGDFSINNQTISYSPFSSYVGVKVPEGDGWNGALFSNDENLISIVTVDENGNSVDRKGLKIEIFDVRWRWWWERSYNDDLARYVSNKSKHLIKSDIVDTKNGKVIYEMRFDKNYYGRKLIRITDPVSGHSTGETFYLTYRGWWNNSGNDNPQGAEMLVFSTDKKEYNVGEKIHVELPEFNQGRALVSIESGSKVVQTFLVNPNENNHKFSFDATPEMAPNVFVNISLIQPHDNKQNDLPIRLYGIQSIKVQDPNTLLKPILEMADELAPENEVELTVSEKNGKKMTYTIAVVDDGLLDLTNFKTPNPWYHFYAKEALGIKTWDMYKYVIGAYSGEMAGLLALGGDEFEKENDVSKVNRFKPVVIFLGPFTVEAGQSNTHKYIMPNYVGSVRTMIVAENNGAYGSTEKTTPVKKPLMVLATLPRVVSPQDYVTLPVTVFAMDKSVKNVSISVETNDFFTVEDQSTKSLAFNEVGDQVINFKLKVSDQIGKGKVKVMVKSGKKEASHEIDIAVRIPNPRIEDITEAMIEPGSSWSSNYNLVGIKGTNSGVLEVSSIPPLNLESRLQYLIRYPHGCIEQTTSSVFPQLFLSNLLDLTKDEKNNIQKNIDQGIRRIKTFQLKNGGFSYWPNYSSSVSEWGTNYAGHFLIEAKNNGYNVPDELIKKWVKYQKQRANTWSRYYDSGVSSELVQSYRLYTLALADKPALGAMNRMKEIKDLTIASKWRLAGAYVLAGKKEVAKSIVRNLGITIENYKASSYTYGSKTRDEAMILEVLTLLGDYATGKSIMDNISKRLSSNSWYSTQTTAYSLMSISKYVGNDLNEEMFYEITVNGNTSSVSTKSPISQNVLSFKSNGTGTVKLVNNSKKKIFIKQQLSGIPISGDNSSAQSNLTMKVTYLDLKENIISVREIEQGTDFIAEVEIYHPGLKSNYTNLALTQIFPSGWEIRNTRMDVNASTLLKDKPDYQDFRDDRVMTYFNISKNKKKKFRVILNASYLGEFNLPTVYCEAMYENEINARVGGYRVKVVQPGGELTVLK